MGRLLRESALAAPVVKKGEYDYFVHPLTDGVPRIEPALLREVVEEVATVANLQVDLLLTAEAMGIPLATALSERTGIPFAIVRKRPYGLPGEVAVHQQTGYSTAQLYLNGVRPGDRVLFIDDVISTGGTLGPLIEAVRRAGATLVDVVIVFEKGQGRALIEEKYGLKVKTLLRLEVRDGKVVLP